MALTRLDHTGDGIRTVYDLAFELGYLREEDIFVSLDSNDFGVQLGYTFLNSAQIVLDAPVNVGVAFNIRRVVDRTKPINDYTEGAILRESNLDASFLQPLMIQQEIEDGYIAVGKSFDVAEDLNLLGHRLYNLADPETDTDATNKKFVTDLADTVTALVLDEIQRVEDEALKVAGGTMTGILSGVNSILAQDFMPQLQITETIDARMQSAPEFDPNNFQDYGLVTSIVADALDYGSI